MLKSYHATCAAEIRSILQIEENVCISGRQISTYAGRGMVAVHFLPEFQYPGRYR